MNRSARVEATAGESPLLRSAELDDLAQRPVYVKYEGAHPGGSFKWRPVQRYVRTHLQSWHSGLATYSSGNQGIAVATLARSLGIPATIVVPEDIAAAKGRTLRALGAALVHHRRGCDDRRVIAERLAREAGLLLVPSSDDGEIIDGSRSIARELCGVELEEAYLPVGGGGLLAACCGALSAAVRVFGVEPAALPKFARALEGSPLPPAPIGAGLADALSAAAPSPPALAAARSRTITMLTVDDGELVATRALFERLFGRRAEYGAVAGLAAMLRRSGGAAVSVVTGSNADDA
jgi:threo-3-hydroxy-L-aspartate ammonia-lyase